jgi:hypothetical protein
VNTRFWFTPGRFPRSPCWLTVSDPLASSQKDAFFHVCRAWATAWRCKSSTQPDGGEGLAKRKGEITLAARRGLKEARSKDASR